LIVFIYGLVRKIACGNPSPQLNLFGRYKEEEHAKDCFKKSKRGRY
jgi:hypothetical protein